MQCIPAAAQGKCRAREILYDRWRLAVANGAGRTRSGCVQVAAVAGAFVGNCVSNRRQQFCFVDRFGYIPVHACCQIGLPVALHGIGCQCEDRYQRTVGAKAANGLRRCDAVHLRHLYVHQDKVVDLSLDRVHGEPAVVYDVDVVSAFTRTVLASSWFTLLSSASSSLLPFADDGDAAPGPAGAATLTPPARSATPEVIGGAMDAGSTAVSGSAAMVCAGTGENGLSSSVTATSSPSCWSARADYVATALSSFVDWLSELPVLRSATAPATKNSDVSSAGLAGSQPASTGSRCATATE